MKSRYVQYYVEGEDEDKLIGVLKRELGLIVPGKVQRLNVVEREISDARLRTLARGTMVVLVFDTDTGHVEILEKNINKLQANSFVSSIVTIPQVPNLEGELIRCCDIRKITELLNSKSREEFKRDLLHVSNLASKLREHKFDVDLFWSGIPTEPYQNIENQSAIVKLRAKDH